MRLLGCLAVMVIVAVAGFLATLAWLVHDELDADDYADTELSAW